MNTNEAVEAVAIALCESALGGKRCPCKEAGKFNCADEFPGRQARAALAAARPIIMEEAWQPIETFSEPTALSSGNGVLVACVDGTVGEAYFRNYGDDSDGWWWANTSWGDYPDPERPNPTHWQPLPASPAMRRAGGGT